LLVKIKREFQDLQFEGKFVSVTLKITELQAIKIHMLKATEGLKLEFCNCQ